MKIKANGISMNYEIKGKGKNLILIHGAGDNLNMWYYQVPIFSKSYRVITYDVRGSGKTESPLGKYSTVVFAKDAYELMKSIKVKDAYLLGYSMGGRIALALALEHPEMVKALILTNSRIGLTPTTPEGLGRLREILELLNKGDIRTFAEKMTTYAFSPQFKTKNPTDFEKYMKIKLQNSPNGLTRVIQSISIISQPDLRKLKCPVLLIVGEKDINMGIEQGIKTHEAIVGSKLVILPTGHASAIESPDKFNAAVLEFLSEVSKR